MVVIMAQLRKKGNAFKTFQLLSCPLIPAPKKKVNFFYTKNKIPKTRASQNKWSHKQKQYRAQGPRPQKKCPREPEPKTQEKDRGGDSCCSRCFPYMLWYRFQNARHGLGTLSKTFLKNISTNVYNCA